MLSDLATEEGDALAHLFDAVDAVLDADPAVEADGGEGGEDGVVVVESAADDAVAEALGVTDGVFFLAKVIDRALGEVAVAGMHRDDAVLDAAEQVERVFAGEDRVAGV